MLKRLSAILFLLVPASSAIALSRLGSSEPDPVDGLMYLGMIIIFLAQTVPAALVSSGILAFTGLPFLWTFIPLLLLNIGNLYLIYDPLSYQMAEPHHPLVYGIAAVIQAITILLISRFAVFRRLMFKVVKIHLALISAVAGNVVMYFLFINA